MMNEGIHWRVIVDEAIATARGEQVGITVRDRIQAILDLKEALSDPRKFLGWQENLARFLGAKVIVLTALGVCEERMFSLTETEQLLLALRKSGRRSKSS